MNASLAALQAAFHDHLLDRPSTFAAAVAPGGRIDAARRLHIYHHAYRARLLENLQDAFEKTWTYLGDDAFEAAALAFVAAHPPQHRNLRWHGAEFPRWLAARYPQDVDIAELAMIDWQLRSAFDGPDAAPLAPATLAGLDAEQWETVGFRFAPTLFFAPLRSNAAGIWHALDRGEAPPPAASLPDAAWLLIWRKGWQPHFRTIDAVEHAALSQLREGASFASVCASLGDRAADGDAAATAAQHLGTWLRDELVVGLTGLASA
jgi:hypothetical protein